MIGKELTDDVAAVSFDTAVYSLDVLRRAAHRFLAEYFVDIHLSEHIATVELQRKSAQAVPHDLPTQLKNFVLDESLRAVVRAETRGIHETLLRGASVGWTKAKTTLEISIASRLRSESVSTLAVSLSPTAVEL